MTGALQRELAFIIEILESTKNSYTQKFRDAQQEEHVEDSITVFGNVPESGQTEHQSVLQSKSDPQKGSNTPDQLLTPGSTPTPPIVPTTEPEINTLEADSGGAASEGCPKENDCIVVNLHSSPSAESLSTAEKIAPKSRRARQVGISAESRACKPTAKGEDYVETCKGKHRHEMAHNTSNFAYLAAFLTGLKYCPRAMEADFRRHSRCKR
jgi:hypothetical protein